MATTDPTATMRSWSSRWDGAIGSAVPSGINGDPAHYSDPGKHISRNDNIQLFGWNAWCVTLPKDKAGPGDKACAIDMNMGRADQNKVHNRYIQVYKDRAWDPRAKYVHAFNGWNGTGQPMRYNLVNGATAVTDSSHTWHEHVETFYGYVNDPAMVEAQMSIITGESAAAYAARVGGSAPLPQDGDDVDAELRSYLRDGNRAAFPGTSETHQGGERRLWLEDFAEDIASQRASEAAEPLKREIAQLRQELAEASPTIDYKALASALVAELASVQKK